MYHPRSIRMIKVFVSVAYFGKFPSSGVKRKRTTDAKSYIE